MAWMDKPWKRREPGERGSHHRTERSGRWSETLKKKTKEEMKICRPDFLPDEAHPFCLVGDGPT